MVTGKILKDENPGEIRNCPTFVINIDINIIMLTNKY